VAFSRKAFSRAFLAFDDSGAAGSSSIVVTTCNSLQSIEREEFDGPRHKTR